jgi:hypothetical protein
MLLCGGCGLLVICARVTVLVAAGIGWGAVCAVSEVGWFVCAVLAQPSRQLV